MPLTNITQSQVNEWIDALRSGDYKQANGALARIDTVDGTVSHCCLGVYGVLNGGKVGEIGALTFENFARGPVNSFVSEMLMSFNAQSFFSSLNDSYGLTFVQIANVAEDLPLLAYQEDSWWEERFNAQRINGMREAFTALKRVSF
jgi:hypothetical protein